MLAASIEHFNEYLKENKNNKFYLLIFIFIMILIIITQSNYINYEENNYWSQWQGRRIEFITEWFKNDLYLFSKFSSFYQGEIYFIFSIISFFLLTFLLLIRTKKIKIKNYFLFSIIFLVFSELFFLANIQWALPGSAWGKKYINEDNILESLNKSFDSHSIADKVYGNEYYKRDKKFMTNYIEILDIIIILKYLTLT